MDISQELDLCATPAGRSPDGNYNFVNPPSLTTVNLSVGSILVGISVILTISRLYVNRKRLHSADYFALAASLVNITFTGIVFAQYKFNRHLWDIPVCWFTASYFKIVFLQTTFFAPVFILSKAAIFMLYKQLFGVAKRINVAVNIGLAVSVALYLPGIPLSAIFDAPAVGEPWTIMLQDTKSRKMIVWGIIQSSITILLDFYIFFLPIPVIVKLHMPMTRRIQLIGVFTTALMGIVASVLSLAYRIDLLHAEDPLWPQTIVTLCAVVEINVAIIVACTPSLANLLKNHIGTACFFQSLRSIGQRLWSGSRGGHSGSADAPGKATGGSDQLGHYLPTPGPATVPHRRDYYELNESAFSMTHSAQQGIIRSVDISQTFGPGSTDRIV